MGTGHGFIMALAAFMLLINEKKLLKFKDGGEVCVCGPCQS